MHPLNFMAKTPVSLESADPYRTSRKRSAPLFIVLGIDLDNIIASRFNSLVAHATSAWQERRAIDKCRDAGTALPDGVLATSQR